MNSYHNNPFIRINCYPLFINQRRPIPESPEVKILKLQNKVIELQKQINKLRINNTYILIDYKWVVFDIMTLITLKVLTYYFL